MLLLGGLDTVTATLDCMVLHLARVYQLPITRSDSPPGSRNATSAPLALPTRCATRSCVSPSAAVASASGMAAEAMGIETDLQTDAVKSVAHKIGKAAFGVKADVSKPMDWQKAVAIAVSRFGRLDIVVNNAGTTHVNKPMLDVTEREFDRIFDVNVKSIYLSALAAVPSLRRAGGGVFINIASTAGLRPRPGLTVYNASKGAVNVMTKSMAVEFARDRIRVCALCPVAGDTPLLAAFLGKNKREDFVKTVPLGRLYGDELRGWLAMLVEASYQSIGYRRVKNPRIWSMHDLRVLVGGPR